MLVLAMSAGVYLFLWVKMDKNLDKILWIKLSFGVGSVLIFSVCNQFYMENTGTHHNKEYSKILCYD